MLEHEISKLLSRDLFNTAARNGTKQLESFITVIQRLHFLQPNAIGFLVFKIVIILYYSLVQLMACTTRVGMRFCPLEYIRVMSKELERKTKGRVIKGCCNGKFDRLIQCNNVLCVDIRHVDKGRNIESTGEETEQVDSDYITKLIEVLTHDHVLVFTDGSVYSPGSASSVGCGACAAVLFPRIPENFWAPD